MKKITDKNIYLAIDERIDRLDTLLINRISVLEERIKYLEEVDKSYKSDIDGLEEKIKHMKENIDTIHDNTNNNLEEISDNKFKIKFNYDESPQSNTQLKSEIDDLRQQIDYFEQKTPGKNKKYIHYKWEKNLGMHEIREEMCLIMNDVWKGLNLDNATDGEPCDCICQSSINDKYIKVDNRVIKFIKTAVKEKLNKMEDE